MRFINLTVISFYSLLFTASSYLAPFKEDSYGKALDHNYIVTLGDSCTLDQHLSHIARSRKDLYFNNITDLVQDLQIYSGYFPPEVLADIRSDVCVKEVSPDYLLIEDEIGARRMPEAEVSGDALISKRALVGKTGWTKKSQRYAPWNLRMIAINEKKPLPRPFNPDRNDVYDYVQDPGKAIFFFSEALPELLSTTSSGEGVDVYVIDTDFNVSHPDFADRARVQPGFEIPPGGTNNGHGTVVASVAVGSKFGVAKSANLTFMYALQESRVFEAFLMVIAIHGWKSSSKDQNPNWKGSVINLSRGIISSGGLDPNMAKLSQMLDDRGIILVASAGNEKEFVGSSSSKRFGSACTAPGVICVGAVDRNYQEAAFSNYGHSINIWAPGHEVPVPVNLDGSTGYSLADGTSVAAPHVAGIVATMLSFEGEINNFAAVDSTYVRLALVINTKRDFIQVGQMPEQHQFSFAESRNLLANTGIHTRDDPEWAYRNSMDIEETISEVPLSVGLFDRANVGEPTCFPSGGSERMFKFRADTLLARLAWESGHYYMYHHANIPQPLVPCVEDACLYVNGTTAFNYNDVGVLARYVLKIRDRCRLPREDSQPGEPTTGGRIQISPGRFIVLGMQPGLHTQTRR